MAYKKQENFTQYEIETQKDELPLASMNNGLLLKGGRFTSPNYIRDTKGWNIDADGNAEFNSGIFRGRFEIGGTIITVTKIADLQGAINEVSDEGGGTVNLVPGTYTATANITLPSNVTLDGNGSTIDFGGGAFQVLIQGTNAYSTGTITATYGSAAIVGVGTTWTSDMVGRSILLGDYWYEITAFTDTTHITIGSVFIGTNLSGDTYVIATTVNNTRIEKITLTNSSVALLKFRYVNLLKIVEISLISALQGIDGSDSNNIYLLDGSFVDSCTSDGIVYNNVPFCVFDNFLISNITGTGLDLTRVSNTGIGLFSLQGITGVGLKFTNCYDLGLINYAFIKCSSHAIEFVSGNRDMNIGYGYIDSAGGDGIKLTATSDTIEIQQSSIINCTGYGINIAAVTDDNNIIAGNSFINNTAGNIQDLGTLTIIAGNSPIAVNTSTVNISGNQTVAGVKTFSSDPLIPDEVYGVGWNGSLEPPTKNAVYDKIETLSTVFKTGVFTKDMSTTTTTTIAHGLGKTPVLVKIRCYFRGSNDLMVMSDGTFITGSQNCIYAALNDSGPTGSVGTDTVGVHYEHHNGDPGCKITGVISVDGTNITITWTEVSNSPADTAAFIWEVA